jgi:hypothetical protein
LAARYIDGKKVEYNHNVMEINKHNTFQSAKWTGPKDIEQAFGPESKTGSLAASIKVFAVTQDNINDVAKFIDTGEVDEKLMSAYREKQQDIINKVRSGEIKVASHNGISVVEPPEPCATSVAYAYNPVGIAYNPKMGKYSVFQHEEGYVEMKAIQEDLAKLESGWGGSPTFLGSKQGEPSELTMEQIKKVVSAHLTDKYREHVHPYSNMNGKNVSR